MKIKFIMLSIVSIIIVSLIVLFFVKHIQRNKKDDSVLSIEEINNETISEEKIEKETEEDNKVTEENIEETEEQESNTKEEKEEKIKENNISANKIEPSKEKTNTNVQKEKNTNVTNIDNTNASKQEEEKKETTISNTKTDTVVENNSQDTNTNSDSNIMEETNEVETHPELAFTGYAERNTAKEQTVIKWVKEQLSQEPYAVEFGYTVQSGTIAKEKMDGFTMVEARVKNRVKNSAGGNYYVYVEDLYMYNSDGTAVNLADTLVYIYNQF